MIASRSGADFRETTFQQPPGASRETPEIFPEPSHSSQELNGHTDMMFMLRASVIVFRVLFRP